MKALIAILIILLSSISSAEYIYEIGKLPSSAYTRMFDSPAVCVENPIYDAYDNVCALCIVPGMAIVRTTDITPPTRKHKLFEVILTYERKSYRLLCGGVKLELEKEGLK
jgi:hypothetical protein